MKSDSLSESPSATPADDAAQDAAQDAADPAAVKELAQQQFAGSAERFVESKLHREGDDLSRLVALAELRGDERVLDIATGGGHTALAFSRRAREVTASDLTPRMLEVAAAFLREQGAHNVRTARADAEALPFADGSFEVVTARIAPHHFPRPERFVREAARVLVPGGRFLLDDNMAPEDDELDVEVRRGPDDLLSGAADGHVHLRPRQHDVLVGEGVRLQRLLRAHLELLDRLVAVGLAARGGEVSAQVVERVEHQEIGVRPEERLADRGFEDDPGDAERKTHQRLLRQFRQSLLDHLRRDRALTPIRDKAFECVGVADLAERLRQPLA